MYFMACTPSFALKPHSIMLLLNALSEFNFKEQLESLSEVRNPPASHLKSFSSPADPSRRGNPLRALFFSVAMCREPIFHIL